MNKTLWITRTAVLLALVVAVQFIGSQIPAGAVVFGPMNVRQLITGSLVNLMLIISASIVTLSSGVIIGAASALIATLIGIGPIFPQITPVIAIANMILTAVVYFGFKMADHQPQNAKLLRIMAVVLAAVLKTAFLWVVVPIVLKTIPDIKPPQVTTLSLMFSWPQIITALLGGGIALLVYPALAKSKLGMKRYL